MNRVITILLSNWAICCYEAAALGFAFMWLFRLRREKKKTAELSTIQKEKAREDNLDQVLKNRLYPEEKESGQKNSVPYEVDFHEETGKKGKDGDNIAIQIIEKGKLSTRKYVFFVSDVVTVGKGEGNALVINDLKVAKEQCRIFKHEDSLYIQTLEEVHPVRLCRKKNRMQMTKNAVKLMENDSIELGDTVLNIHFI